LSLRLVSQLIIVAALAAWRVFFARPVLTESDVILLASFVNKTGDPIFDNSLDKALEVGLASAYGCQAMQTQMRPLMVVIPHKLFQVLDA